MAMAGGPPPAPLPEFFAPYVVPLTVTKKALSLSDGDFAITDANGAVVLKVKGAIFSIRSRRTILDGAGMPLLTMQEKVFSMHHRWEVFRGDSTSSGDLLFSVKTTSLIQLKTEMDVFLAGNTAQQVCDFKIKGSYFDRSCVFYLGDSNNMVAQMSRKLTVSNVLLGRDTFSVTVFPHVDYVFIASLVVILDELVPDHPGRSSRCGALDRRSHMEARLTFSALSSVPLLRLPCPGAPSAGETTPGRAPHRKKLSAFGDLAWTCQASPPCFPCILCFEQEDETRPQPPASLRSAPEFPSRRLRSITS
ncbi:hypothetical protein TRIUR3_16300 [Triticum urartu]|uniref:Protein LURP-one-related 15 n=1 Tax=Triticum urartu TaxID=4572 RepID=M8B4F5_TRIUA|nr:hypothetical protein TRIUR3_16300 [Triticum urartu]